MDWFSDSFNDRTKSPRKQGIIESDRAYRDRIFREGKERVIESMAGSAPRQGFFESDAKYQSRIAHDANERLVEKATGQAPQQGRLRAQSAHSRPRAGTVWRRTASEAAGS